ncbi:MAG: long-chain fatty acid--CoA ligase [Clostridiales Family XIII bacterium]|nr:long-chain fatty acid--CoA ligase [Clostridiales Family XIII bacterium]
MREKNVTTVGQIYKNNYSADKPAILFKGEVITYAQLDDRVMAFANLLKSKGVASGDKVILNTVNSPEFVYIYLGTVRNAAIIVPINPMLTLEEMKYIASDSKAKFLVMHEGIMMKQGLTPDVLSEALGITVIPIGESLIAEASSASRDDYDMVADGGEVSTFLYTSGTTGQPKAAMLTHDNLVTNAWQCVVNLEAREDDVLMCVLPMFHVFAFTTCILLPLIDGETIDIVESFTPKTVISELIEKQVSLFLGVPAMYMILVEAGKKDIKFPKLRTAVCGGSALPVEIYNQVRETIGLPIIEGYGLTEASPACFFNPPSGTQKPGSIGKAMTGIDYRIGDENDEDMPPGEVGELLLKGPNIMLGYYGREAETAETLRNGWLHTGDLAKKDEDGYVYIVDRKKDMIIVSGLNVYPREVEEALYKHPKIKDAAVIGVQDGLRGEKVMAYIVPKEGEEVHSKEILRWLKERLAAYKIPRHIEFKEDLPRNSTGKIMKRMLREE